MIFLNLLFSISINHEQFLFNRCAIKTMFGNLAKLTQDFPGSGLFWHFAWQNDSGRNWEKQVIETEDRGPKSEDRNKK